MNILFPPSPDIKFDVDPMIMLLGIKQEEKGIEPILPPMIASSVMQNEQWEAPSVKSEFVDLI